MTDSLPTLDLKQVDFRVLPMRTRFPFKYGIASLTALPHLVLQAKVEVNGTPADGIASEGLPPKWFTKSPDTTFEQDLPAMLTVIDKAANLALGSPPSSSSPAMPEDAQARAMSPRPRVALRSASATKDLP